MGIVCDYMPCAAGKAGALAIDRFRLKFGNPIFDHAPQDCSPWHRLSDRRGSRRSGAAHPAGCTTAEGRRCGCL
ncbi:protein of unknown function [Denitratisoma oestradiolicum]|uniref:Uncharacterized protein n=1 Tax=Denitratisoma oestradiolicum TaxID=311182 RepID=A0A6S6XTN3_9PROT|nr:protein of unknown function [Denitratisoma oestradiolicum]